MREKFVFEKDVIKVRRSSHVRRERVRRSSLLLVDARENGAAKRVMFRAGTIVLSIVAVVGTLAVAYVGVKYLGRLTFRGNGSFTIRRMAVQTHGQLLSESFVRACMPVDVGTNMFAVNIHAMQKEFMKRAPSVQQMYVSRRLPDTLEVEVWERIPVAWLAGPRRFLAVDREGVVFRYASRARRLPTVAGVEGPAMQEGQRIGGLINDALAVIGYCENTAAAQSIKVAKVDVSAKNAKRADAIRLELATGEVVDLWWRRARKGGEGSG